MRGCLQFGAAPNYSSISREQKTLWANDCPGPFFYWVDIPTLWWQTANHSRRSVVKYQPPYIMNRWDRPSLRAKRSYPGVARRCPDCFGARAPRTDGSIIGAAGIRCSHFYGVIGFAARLFFVAPLSALAIARLLRISLKAQLQILIGPTAAAAVMAVAVIAFQFAVPSAVPLGRFAGSVLTGVATYSIALWSISPALFASFKSLLPRRIMWRS
jgi:hypothetical protein